MKKNFPLLLVLLNLSFNIRTYCQQINPIIYSISAGINTSEYTYGGTGTLSLNSPYSPIKYGIGLDFSISSDIPIYKCLFLKTGISYMYSNSEFYIPDFYPVFVGYTGLIEPYYTNYLSTNRICIPLLIKLSRTKTANNVYLAAGFDIIYNISSSLTTVGFPNDGGQEEFILSDKETNSFGLDYKIVIGKYFHIRKKQFFTEFQYAHDITNQNYLLTPLFNYPSSNPILPLKNYSASVIIGWAFK